MPSLSPSPLPSPGSLSKNPGDEGKCLCVGVLGTHFPLGPHSMNGFIYYCVCAPAPHQRGWFYKNDALDKNICILVNEKGINRKFFLSPQVFWESNLRMTWALFSYRNMSGS